MTPETDTCVAVAAAEQAITRLVARRLGDIGFSVGEAHSYQEMLAICRALNPRLLIVNMFISGWAMQPTRIEPPGTHIIAPHESEQVRTLLEAIPKPSPRMLFLYSKAADFKNVWDFTDAPWADALLKPFTPKQLVEKVQHLMSAPIDRPW